MKTKICSSLDGKGRLRVGCFKIAEKCNLSFRIYVGKLHGWDLTWHKLFLIAYRFEFNSIWTAVVGQEILVTHSRDTQLMREAFKFLLFSFLDDLAVYRKIFVVLADWISWN